MRKILFSFLAVVVVLGGAFWSASGNQASAHDAAKILEFDTMVGVPRPYTGATNAIRGMPGGGLPWVVGDAEGELTADGRLQVKVHGLVLDPTDPTVIANGLAGQNPSPNFRAIVSCQSKDSAGNPTVVNLTTGLFPATTGLGGGNAKIKAHVNLPTPCIAPIIFVTSPTGSWFAATGQ
jgi:hypothetical protein